MGLLVSQWGNVKDPGNIMEGQLKGYIFIKMIFGSHTALT